MLIVNYFYQSGQLSRLKDPLEAAGYIETILEEEDPEPLLLKHALQDVALALGELNLPKEQAQLHLEKLERILSVEGSAEIYNLALWLDKLGLKLTVTVKSDNSCQQMESDRVASNQD